MCRKKNIIVALSGGADSVALLFALLQLKDELELNISACHVNHNLRGEESDGDEDFVRSLCEKLSVPLEVRSVDIISAQKKHESIEETARKARYSFFEELAERYSASVATAHTASDNSETVLMNMLRGTGLKGLCGIPPVRDYIIRPLIACTRNDTEKFCAENNLGYVTDSSNLSTLYTRNKIRLEIMPQLLEINPSFAAAVTRMTAGLADDSRYLEKIAEEEKAKAFDGDAYDCTMLALLGDCILSRIVSGMLSDGGVEPSALQINAVCALIRKGTGKINLKKNTFAQARRKKIKICYEEQKYRRKN